MRKLLIAISLFLMTFCLSSCVGANSLDEIAIVQSIGIDLEEDKTISLTLQIYTPQGAGSNSAIDISKNNSSIIKSSGKTISNAMQNATTIQGKNIFTGNNRLIIVGEDFAKNGIKSLFSYFNRSSLTRQNTQVLMAQGRASDIVGVNIYQGILAAETIEEMVNNNKENGIVNESPYYWISKNTTLNNGDGAMPIIKLDDKANSDGNKNSDDSQKSDDSQIKEINKVKLDGTAIFNDYKFTGVEDYEKTRGMVLIRDKLEQSIISVDKEDIGTASVKIYKCKSKIKPIIDGDKVIFTLDVNASARLKELLYTQDVDLTKQLVDSIEKKCEEKLAKEIKDVFSDVINKKKSDIFDLKDLILKYQKDFYIKNQNNIEEIVFNSEIKPNIKLEIDRIGLESDQKIS